MELQRVSNEVHNRIYASEQEIKGRLSRDEVEINARVDKMERLLQASKELLAPFALTSSNSILREHAEQILMEKNK